MTDNKKDQKKAERKTKNPQPKQRQKKFKTFQDKELERMMVRGEEVILRANLHGALYWKTVAVLILACIFFITSITAFGFLFGFVGLLMLAVSILTQHYLLLAITNKRVLARYGLLQMDVVDIRLSKIESIDLERMLPGHIFGYANVVVMGTGNRMLRVPYISNAEAFRRFYNEMVLAEEGSEEGEAEVRNLQEQIVEQAGKPMNKRNKV